MSDEHAILRLGMDSAGAAAATRSFKSQMTGWAKDLTGSVKGMFSGMLAPLSAAGLVYTMKGVVDDVERLQASAKALGTGTDFAQDLNNIAKAAGMSGQAVESMVNKWVKTLPAGADVERSFYTLADRIGAIADPVAKAQAAIDAFGKSGIDMLKIVGDGSKGIQEMASEFKKFSEAEIRDILAADAQIDKFSNSLTIYVGKILAALSFGAKTWGTLSATGDWKKHLTGWGAIKEAAQNTSLYEAEEADEMIIKEQALARAQAKRRVADETAEKVKKALEETAKATLEIEKKATAEAEKQLKLEQAILEKRNAMASRMADTNLSVENQLRSPGKFTVDELAQLPTRGGQMARDVNTLRGWSKQNAMRWNMDLADKQNVQADKIFRQLADSNPYLDDPMQALLVEMRKQNADMSELALRAAGSKGGVAVSVTMAD